jgi:uncharacterized membrane protein
MTDTDRFISLALLFPALALTIAAWSLGRRRDSSAAIQNSKWRKIVTIVGLLFLTADVLLSAGYLLYAFSVGVVKFSVFDACSSIGTLLCLVGIVAASLGKAPVVRPLIVCGSFGGMLFGT